MNRILKNNTASPVLITDTGITVPASGSYTIAPEYYGKFEASVDVITLLTNHSVSPTVSTLTANDGSVDLPENDGVRLILGEWSRQICDADDTSVKVKVFSTQSSTYYDKRMAVDSVVSGLDSLGAFRRVSTKVRGDGLTALATDATVVVESTFGFDQQPDSYFQIVNTGAAGDTWTVYIAGTSVDPTTPDRDIPSYTKVFTVVAGEVGDEIKLRDRIIQELNSDSAFKTTCFLRAQKATDRGVVHIQSLKFSVSGEFYERPMSGDFNVTVTGTAVRILGFDNFISRSKPVTISRDVDSPHRLGLFGVTGSVSITFKQLSDLFIKEALNGSSPAMNVLGSLVSPVIFRVDAQPLTDIYIDTLIWHGAANGIKFGQFMAKSTSLVNGCLLEIKSDDIPTAFPIIYATEDFKNDFAAYSGDGANFRLDIQAGRDEFLAILKFPNPFIIRAAGTFTVDDYIKVAIRDDLRAGLFNLSFQCKGFEKEP
jgi:hypothetical protein